MGLRGPAPKPNHLKLADGNPGKRPLNPNEAKVPVSQRIPCPEWFDEQRRRLWDEVCKELASMGGLSFVDTQMLVLYTDTLAQTQSVIKKIIDAGDTAIPVEVYDKHGNLCGKGYRNSAHYKQMVELKKLSLTFASHFGQTPSSRTRINFPGNAVPILPDQEEEEEKDPFDMP